MHFFQDKYEKSECNRLHTFLCYTYFFTLIIPTFNADQIGKLLYSVVRQNEPDLQVIICDDSESDGVYRIYNKYSAYLNLVYFKTDKHKTNCPGNTRYDGMKHIPEDTKYVLFLPPL